MYAKAVYLDRGGDPSVIDDLPWQTVAAWLSIHGLLEQRASLGGLVSDE